MDRLIDRILAALKRTGRSQAWLERASGLKPGEISQAKKRGTNAMRADRLKRIADALEVGVSELVGDGQPPQQEPSTTAPPSSSGAARERFVDRPARYANIDLAIAYNASKSPTRWSDETVAAGRATALKAHTDRSVADWEAYLDDLEKSIAGAKSAFDGPVVEPDLENTPLIARKRFLEGELEKLGKAAFKEKYGAATVAAVLRKFRR